MIHCVGLYSILLVGMSLSLSIPRLVTVAALANTEAASASSFVKSSNNVIMNGGPLIERAAIQMHPIPGSDATKKILSTMVASTQEEREALQKAIGNMEAHSKSKTVRTYSQKELDAMTSSHHANPFEMSVELLKEGTSHLQKAIASKVTDLKDLHSILHPPPPSPPSFFDRFPKPVRGMGALLQRTMVNNYSDDRLKFELKWIPANFKGPVKNFIKDMADWMINSICRGKVHHNPNIVKLANDAQVHVIRNNPDVNFAMGMLAFNTVCITKILPFR